MTTTTSSTKNMQEFVEGDWKTFTFRQATDDDFEGIMDLVVNHFMPDEPITKLLVPDEEYIADFKKLFRPLLADNLSFIAVDKATGQYAAARINFNHRKDIDWTKFELKSEKLGRLMVCVEAVDKEANLFEKYNLDTYADLFSVMCHKSYRQQGLVTEMYRRSVALARAEGYFLAKATFSSPFSRAGAATAGFKEVARLKLMDFKTKDGDLLLPGATEENLITQAIYIL